MKLKNNYERWDKMENGAEYFAHLEVSNGIITLEMGTNKFLDAQHIAVCREIENRNKFKTWGKAHEYLMGLGFHQAVKLKRNS